MDISVQENVSIYNVNQSVTFSFDAPFLSNINTGQRYRTIPNAARFIKLLADHYPNLVTKQELYSHFDSPGRWLSCSNINGIIFQSRLAFRAVGCDKPFETVYNKGYRLLVPVQLIGDDVPLIVPSDEVSLLKYLLTTHPETDVTQPLLQKLFKMESSPKQ